MSVLLNGMTREPSISGSDSRPSASSPPARSPHTPSRGSLSLATIHGNDARKGGDMDGDGYLGVEQEEEGRQERRGHRNRKSSDFLLDSGRSSFRRSSHYQYSKQRDNERLIGKGKQRDGEMLVGKHRSPHGYHRQGLSLGSSPLATAVTSASAAEESPQSDTDRSRLTGNTTHNEEPSTQSNPPPPSVGYDTDPAQIVNLALNLSESRKKHLPGRLPSRTMSGGRKRTTTGQFAPYLGDRQHQDLQEDRFVDHGMHDISSVQDKDKRSSAGPAVVPGTFLPRLSPSADGSRGYMDPKDKYVPLELSDATIIRAEKAKQHFELLYEYLRLLPHLPPLRRPSHKSSSNFTSGAASTSPDSLPPTRVYNPLQYIRNRKLRFREKCPIDTEQGGWHAVENVHNWVNSVSGLNREPSGDPDEYLRLPPIDADDQNEPNAEEKADDNEIGSAASSIRRNNGNNNTKPRRPRVDWIVRPPDLLADAAWLEGGNNKSKIEDRYGNKIYPPGTSFRDSGWQGVHPGVESTPPQNEDIPPGQDLTPRDTLPSAHTGTSRDTKSIDRGRRKHKISRSIHLSPSRSPSTKPGKFKWRRALSRSSSSSSDSDLDLPQNKRKRADRLNGIDTSLLDKQIMNLQRRGIGQLDETPTEDKKAASAEIGLKPYRQPPKLPSLITESLDQRSSSLPPGGKSPVSPALSVADKDRIGRMSLDDMDSTAPNSPSNSSLFPKITINLSPPVSRSSSPAKKPPRPVPAGPHDRSQVKQKDNRDSLELTTDGDASDLGLFYPKSQADIVLSETWPLHDGSPKPKTHPKHEETPTGLLQRSDSSSTKGYRYPGLPESKLRGIFKGGRIAEIVGNEVSRVGDFIWKKDAPATSQQTSAASSIPSDQSDAEDEKTGTSSKSRPLGYFRRKNTDLETYKSHVPSLPNFTSSLKQEDDIGEQTTHSQPASVDYGLDQKPTPEEATRPSLDYSRKLSKVDGRSISPTGEEVKSSPTVPKGYGFGPGLLTPGKGQNRVKDLASGAIGREQLPVTGLTSLDPSSQASRPRRPTLSRATRDWSISSRSITTTADTSLADKREIARVRALLLSSGIKAHEITRRAGETRDPPPDFLLRSRHCSKDPIPRVTRAEEYIYAARSIDYALKRTIPPLQNSMNNFSKSTCPNLKFELSRVEKVITDSLTQRTRSAASAAEDLSTELNTTNTLAVKQLNDALDKGIRKRNRRLRWLRRVGFVILEWALVGIMWWVWLVVMIWKITRGIWRGTVSGIRWILWL